MLDVLIVAGARPNFMKVKPVLDSVEDLGLSTMLVHTGQHYDERMSDVFFTELGLRPPDRSLGVGSGSHATQTAAVMTGVEALIEEVAPRAVVVAGDVNSTMAAAIVAAKAGCIVVHVESGLRSRDWTMPEEINRVVTDRVSDLLLASSPDAVENLRREGYRDDQVQLVGNVMVDTLLTNLDRALERPVVADLGLEPGGYVLVTLHRPANVDDGAVLGDLLHVLNEVAVDLPVVFPAHPRTLARMGSRPMSGQIHLLEPQGYLDFVALEAGAACVLTDSGGVQEETTVLGVPCLTLRDNTERPITISEGTNRLVGREPAVVLAGYREVRADPPPARRPERWDGKAGLRCAEAISAVLGDTAWRRPTDI
jgi:UDP-N-acetylglucosamine 2-epimerase (non-hydrolysing)